MLAGFGKALITPPVGGHLYGFGGRDQAVSTGIHDDLFVRVLYVEDGGVGLLILGYDLLFFTRAQADRLAGALGREHRLCPQQVLLNTSHTHAGPMIGHGHWCYGTTFPPDWQYEETVEQATLAAARQARATARPATMAAAEAISTLPCCRRRPDAQGRAQWMPHPGGAIREQLPLVLFRDAAGQPISLLFSVSCHPSSVGFQEVSADYPGLAMKLLAKELGSDCCVFLQGTGGDAKAIYTAQGDRFGGSWEAVQKGGEHVAREVAAALHGKLNPVTPAFRYGAAELPFPLQSPPSRAALEADAAGANEWRRCWARELLLRLDRGADLAAPFGMLMQYLELGPGLRLVGVEAEMVAELGDLLAAECGAGITFAMGYCHGTRVYLPTSKMIQHEGGYEVDSYHEYGLPAALAPGVEGVLRDGLKGLRAGA